MANIKDRTKLLFAKQLEQLVKKIPFEKIRILDLCDKCGTVPQTFYYHFTDKYELVAWLYLHDFAEVFCENKSDYTEKILVKILKRMEKRKQFYKLFFNEKTSKYISDYLHKFNMETALSAMSLCYGKEKITKEQILKIKYHSYGTIGLAKEWLCGEGSLSTKEFAEFQLLTIPEFLKKAFDKYPYSRMDILQRAGKYKSNSKKFRG